MENLLSNDEMETIANRMNKNISDQTDGDAQNEFLAKKSSDFSARITILRKNARKTDFAAFLA